MKTKTMSIILPKYRGDDPERIVCAAIHYLSDKVYVHQPINIRSGYVMCGLRHPFIIALHHELTGRETDIRTSVAGFLTTKNRFVPRVEGARIAVSQGQAFDIEDGKELISEDLY